MAGYKSCSRFDITGDAGYVRDVTACLDIVDSIPDGRTLLESIDQRVHMVTIQNTTTGNSCRRLTAGGCPIMPLAIKDGNDTNFKSELNVAVDKAKKSGLTLEHLGRQLAVG